VAIVTGQTLRIGEVVRVEGAPDGDGRCLEEAAIATEVAVRIGGKAIRHRPDGDAVPFADLVPGQLCIAPTRSWQALAGEEAPLGGAAVLMVLETRRRRPCRQPVKPRCCDLTRTHPAPARPAGRR
jgi:hypothetical protein